MTFAIHGLAVARGVAIGRAVLVASSRLDVAHYFIEPAQVTAEINRVRDGRDAVVAEIRRLQSSIGHMGPKETPHELSALLDVHLMLLQDQELAAGVRHWITDRLYNAEWALTSQLDVVVRQFDEMEDDYLRERKADLEQITEKVLRAMRGVSSPLIQPLGRAGRQTSQQDLLLDDTVDVPLILVAHDLSPADMLQFKQSVFAGFITDVGGKTSHTAIVARSLDIPAVVGARLSSHLIQQDDWVVIDGDAGVVVIDPSPIILAEYGFKQRQVELQRGRLARLLHTPAVTLDGQKIELLANIEMPDDASSALKAGAVGVGLFRSEFLFMGRHGKLPNEEEQYLAYRRAVEGMQGLPVTIRTVDVGADKPLDETLRDDAHLNPALGLRAIRWSLADPAMFLTQLRAILRAAAHGQVHVLIPMLVHAREIRQTMALIDHARVQLDNRGLAYGSVKMGAMIEIPAAALTLKVFLKYFDFLSIGTNDLIQYTLAIDRADESVAHLYDPMHPAVLRLVANTIAEGQTQGKPVSLCGEMAGDVSMTRLLLGMGLRSFSMHPAQILTVKQEVLRADTSKLAPWAAQLIAEDEPMLPPRKTA
ncbi:MAG: phosphoenolpyruvate--protein phosphotransferase [Rhodoferax sp.]|uniref:phosphoenolpyruvate--protein phosphotransferase n=1 Tax=Rhodoferax sp. TaxID=50421 RepID=UPI0008BBFC17|nr:phosphoenolpyruvate--protein phosphotransferase [Rhodoferax sp.]MDP2680564.1 phosphoenolpyruvate--protein phosphotransferase [Rhodoferax sp.]OGB51047.1 MAG: phosphoenolpyruvate--protein phosphotransferase [Burkholderiales bacterium RIFOXYD12_FULL_59_19]OGB73911.1 MAG: phosphoenolpyruvate--protein phosphotransferase [Burkholderiales bacterium RIFOXYC12_FULL_60_6]